MGTVRSSALALGLEEMVCAICETLIPLADSTTCIKSSSSGTHSTLRLRRRKSAICFVALALDRLCTSNLCVVDHSGCTVG